MTLAEVVGAIVTTVSHPDYKNRRLLLVRPLSMVGATADGRRESDFVALDTTHAGIGDTVLVNREGNGARGVLGLPDGCVISIIVGIVDSTHVPN